VAIKGVRVADYNGGKSFNTSEDVFVIFNPDHYRTLELRKWYDNLDRNN
jgi:hypothetical protein